jgi:hypothetical protein
MKRSFLCLLSVGWARAILTTELNRRLCITSSLGTTQVCALWFHTRKMDLGAVRWPSHGYAHPRISGRIGRATGRGIAANIDRSQCWVRFHRRAGLVHDGGRSIAAFSAARAA